MAFGDFTYPEVISALGLTETSADLLGKAPPLPPTPEGVIVFGRYAALARVGNSAEKAKSELVITPVLVEAWARFEEQLNFHSGCELVADPAAKLVGFCDFLVGRGPQLPRPVAPLFVVIEAKRDNIETGYGQCIASMVGLQRLNQKNGAGDRPVFGVISTGSVWRFLKLEGTTLTHDLTEFALTLSYPDRVLGALVAMIESLLAVTP